MLDPRAPPGDGALPDADMIFHTNILSQHFSTPTIMVPGDHEDRDTSIAQFSERGENAKARAGNNGLPFEPELEEVSVDHQRRGAIGQLPEELQHLLLDLRFREA